jgi:hypothetical protein
LDEDPQQREEDWLKKSADVLRSQRPVIGMNLELEQTQMINLKELSQDENSVTGFFAGVKNIHMSNLGSVEETKLIDNGELTFDNLNLVTDVNK